MDFEETLGALSASGAHPALGGLDTAVFARIDADARAIRSARLGMVAAIGAATLAGVAGAAIPTGHAPEASAPLMTSPLAPSTLLGGGR